MLPSKIRPSEEHEPQNLSWVQLPPNTAPAIPGITCPKLPTSIMNHHKENKHLLQVLSLFLQTHLQLNADIHHRANVWPGELPQPNVLPWTILNRPRKGNFPLLPSAAFRDIHNESSSADSNQESIQKGYVLVSHCSSGSSQNPATMPPLKF